MLGRTAVDVYR